MAKRKKKGKYGETVISKFPGAVDALRHRYQKMFPDMMVYLHFNALGKNFIFHKMKSFPLDKISYLEETKSIMFSAKWKAGGALGYLFAPKPNDIKVEGAAHSISWDGIADFDPRISSDGKIQRNERWIDAEDADKIKAEADIRIDNIKSINMYKYGFELIGEVISMICVNSNVSYAGFPKKISMKVSNLSFDLDKMLGDDGLTVRWSQPGYSPIKQETADFNQLLFGEETEKKDVQVKNLGQRCMNSIDIED